MRDIEEWMWAEAVEMLGRAERLQRQFFQPERRARRVVWVPPLDVYESEDQVKVVIALPGVAPDSIKIFYDNHRLVVEGARRVPVSEHAARIRRMEIPHGHFERRLELPPGLRLEGQELVDGCLYLSFRKP